MVQNTGITLQLLHKQESHHCITASISIIDHVLNVIMFTWTKGVEFFSKWIVCYVLTVYNIMLYTTLIWRCITLHKSNQESKPSEAKVCWRLFWSVGGLSDVRRLLKCLQWMPHQRIQIYPKNIFCGWCWVRAVKEEKERHRRSKSSSLEYRRCSAMVLVWIMSVFHYCLSLYGGGRYMANPYTTENLQAILIGLLEFSKVHQQSCVN